MPQTLATISDFPPEKVLLVAVNQLETADTIREFLDKRGWDITVALDPDGRIGKLFQVDSIPELVLIGPDGNIERVYVGDTLELQGRLKKTLIDLTFDDSPH